MVNIDFLLRLQYQDIKDYEEETRMEDNSSDSKSPLPIRFRHYTTSYSLFSTLNMDVINSYNGRKTYYDKFGVSRMTKNATNSYSSE